MSSAFASMLSAQVALSAALSAVVSSEGRRSCSARSSIAGEESRPGHGLRDPRTRRRGTAGSLTLDDEL